MCVLSEIKLFPNETIKILFRNKIRYIFLICKIFSYFFSRKMHFSFISPHFPPKNIAKNQKSIYYLSKSDYYWFVLIKYSKKFVSFERIL